MTNLNSDYANQRFYRRLKNELTDVGRFYLKVARKPSILVTELYNVGKDIFYELPKSFIEKKDYSNQEKHLHENVSQAVVMSEIFSYPGTFAGVQLFKMFGADDYTASIIGGTIGNFTVGTLSYIGSYTVLSRWSRKYSVKQALIDSYKVIRDCLPTDLAMYLSDVPMLTFLIGIGLDRDVAIGINLAITSTVYTSMMKTSSRENISSKESER